MVATVVVEAEAMEEVIKIKDTNKIAKILIKEEGVEFKEAGLKEVKYTSFLEDIGSNIIRYYPFAMILFDLIIFLSKK